MITRIGLFASAMMLTIGCDRNESASTDPAGATSKAGASEPGETGIATEGTRILIYRRDKPGAELTIMMSSFSGVANATVTEGVGEAAAECTVSLPSAMFNKLFDAFASVSALTSAELTSDSPTIESETHHIVTRMDRGTGFQGMYAIPLEGESGEFRAWFKELTEATANK
jgi:hypothetical protein